MEIFLGLPILLERILRPNRVSADQTRQKRHVVAISGSRPIGAVVYPIPALHESQR